LGLGAFGVRPDDTGIRTNTNTQDPDRARRYNIRVPETNPPDDHKHHRHAVYASETTGLLLIALLLLVLTLVRYWHDLHWSLR
jgi:hypothetical protein